MCMTASLTTSACSMSGVVQLPQQCSKCIISSCNLSLLKHSVDSPLNVLHNESKVMYIYILSHG